MVIVEIDGKEYELPKVATYHKEISERDKAELYIVGVGDTKYVYDTGCSGIVGILIQKRLVKIQDNSSFIEVIITKCIDDKLISLIK